MWREVEDVVPVVRPRAYLARSHLREEFLVGIRHGQEFYVSAGFDYGLLSLGFVTLQVVGDLPRSASRA